MPTFEINYVAILIAVVANFILGFIWYTPLFGKVWGREMGYNMQEKPPTSQFIKGIIKGMIFMVIGSFLMAWVFAHNIAAWNPASWGHSGEQWSPVGSAIMAAVFTWLGFFFPNDLGSVAWEKKSWTLFFINTVYHFLSLVVVALIITHI
jgi:hypothetical protein